MKKFRNGRDFEQELKKQEKAFEEPSKRGLPRRAYAPTKVMAWIWLAVAALLLICTLVFLVYEIRHREGLWTVLLLFAGATLISAINGWDYLRKARKAAQEADV